MAFFEHAPAPAASGSTDVTVALSDSDAAAEASSPSPLSTERDEQPSLFPQSLAQRLVAAREARGWTRAVVATKLRLPLRVLDAIENERFDGIGEAVYLRGYLNNYARLVGVPLVAVDTVLRSHAAPPPELVSTGRISHSRFLVERYSRFAPYVGLTAVIFVPLVMIAMNMGSNVGARLTPLDAPPAVANNDSDTSTEPASSNASSTSAADSGAADVRAPAAASSTDAPVMASFALVPPKPSTDSGKAVAAAAADPALLRLSLNEASWVEIVDSDGKRLEYSTLPAGTVKEYPADKSITILLGNTNGAKVDVGAQAQDIAPFVRGNVARFKLGAGSKSISSATVDAVSSGTHNG